MHVRLAMVTVTAVMVLLFSRVCETACVYTMAMGETTPFTHLQRLHCRNVVACGSERERET